MGSGNRWLRFVARPRATAGEDLCFLRTRLGGAVATRSSRGCILTQSEPVGLRHASGIGSELVASRSSTCAHRRRQSCAQIQRSSCKTFQVLVVVLGMLKQRCSSPATVASGLLL